MHVVWEVHCQTNMHILILIAAVSKFISSQDDLLESAPSFAPTDEPLTCEDELDSSPCMLPLVKLTEKAATLWKPGTHNRFSSTQCSYPKFMKDRKLCWERVMKLASLKTIKARLCPEYLFWAQVLLNDDTTK